jgi:hypothetical protein
VLAKRLGCYEVNRLALIEVNYVKVWFSCVHGVTCTLHLEHYQLLGIISYFKVGLSVFTVFVQMELQHLLWIKVHLS